MRPINKGGHPEHDGKPLSLTKYSRGRRFLIDRIGEYCSYCERRIVVNLAVEHIQPKSLEPHLELEWSNFPLGCTNCNSTKGKKPVTLSDFFWPDVDNTYETFEYDNSGIVKVNNNLTQAEKTKAKRTIKLVGLNKLPPNIGTVEWMEASDRRYEHRVQAFKDATRYALEYNNSSEDIKKLMIPLFVTIVLNSGFWSIWMNTFSNHPEVQKELIDSHVGTNSSFF